MLFGKKKEMFEEIKNGGRDAFVRSLINEYQMVRTHARELGCDSFVVGPYAPTLRSGEVIYAPLAFGVKLLGDINYSAARQLGYEVTVDPQSQRVYVQKKFGMMTKTTEKKYLLERMYDLMVEQVMVESGYKIKNDFIKMGV